MERDLVQALTLARKLHLGILRGPPFFAHRQVCMTVQCGCDCRSCKELRVAMVERGFTEDGQLAAPLPPAQPWESRKAA